MNDNTTDTNDNLKDKRRAQLIEQCIQLGMPVAGDEDEETLEMYLDVAYEDDFDELSFDDDDLNSGIRSNESSKGKKSNMFGKLVSLFM